MDELCHPRSDVHVNHYQCVKVIACVKFSGTDIEISPNDDDDDDDDQIKNKPLNWPECVSTLIYCHGVDRE